MMRETLTFIGLFIIGAGCLAQSGSSTAPVTDVTPQELSAMLGRGHLSVIDVNEQDNYTAAHVPGAKRMDYDAIKAEGLPADRSTTLVFYCWSAECPAAGMAAQTATSLGYADVRCMKAGITGWQDEGLPTEP